MRLRFGLQRLVALTTASLAAAVVAAAGLAVGGDMRALAPIGLGVSLTVLSVGLVLAARTLAGAEGRLDQLTAQCEDARREARTDPLTGLGNRRHFDGCLVEAVTAALRRGQPFSVTIFDLDDFKAVNDHHGHAAGDLALRHVAALLRAGTRDRDVVCRWGGEEFAVLMHDTPSADAARLADRIVGALSANAVPAGCALVAITASAGVGCYPADGPDGPSVIEAADAALLRAKALGKNRVERAWSPGIPTALVDLTGRDPAPDPVAVPPVRA